MSVTGRQTDAPGENQYVYQTLIGGGGGGGGGGERHNYIR